MIIRKIKNKEGYIMDKNKRDEIKKKIQKLIEVEKLNNEDGLKHIELDKLEKMGQKVGLHLMEIVAYYCKGDCNTCNKRPKCI